MKIERIVVIAFSILFFTGCPISPPYREHREWLSRLPAGSPLYLYVKNEPSGRLFFDLVARHVYRQNMDVQQLVDNTQALYGAIDDSDYYLLLLGNYPSFVVENSLDSRSDWKKENPKIWTQTESRITVALPADYSLLVTNRDYAPFIKNYQNPAADGIRLPANLEKGMKRGLAGFFFPAFTEYGMPERIPFNKKRLPIKEAWVTIRFENGKYAIESAFNCVEEENARLFTASYKTFLLWLLKEIKIKDFSTVLKETKVLSSDGYLLMEGLSLSPMELQSALSLLTDDPTQP